MASGIVSPGKYDSLSITYFVDAKNSNNNNDGRKLSAAWKTIQKSANNATLGSTVNIRQGIYNENISVNITGTDKHPISFINYQNEEVIIDSTGTSGTTLLTVTHKNFLNFKGMTFQNITKNNAQGILITASPKGKVSNLLFSNIKIKNINWNANPSITPSSDDNSQPFIVYGQGIDESTAVINLTVKIVNLSIISRDSVKWYL